jgi:ligand-binding sensor domain-containing protein
MIDHSGLLWLGGEVRGLATTHPDGAPFPYVLDLHPGSNRIDTNNLRVLQESADGKLWLGTEGDGLKRYDPANGQFERYADVFEPLLDPVLRGRPMRILGLAEGEADTLWVSGNQGLFHFDPAQRRARRVPIRLDADAPPNRDPSALRSMLRARDGSIWIGSYNVGLVHFYPQTETWRFYRHDPEDEDSLSHSLINTIFEDRRGRIWVGTLAGLDLLDPTSGRIRRFRHDAGDAQSVSGDLVRVVFQGRDDTLWIGTHSGLSQVIEGPDDEIRFRRYGVEQGLPNPTVYALPRTPKAGSGSAAMAGWPASSANPDGSVAMACATACRTWNSTAEPHSPCAMAASPSAAPAVSTCSTRRACRTAAMHLRWC